MEGGWIAQRQEKREGGTLSQYTIVLRINIYMTWPLMHIVESYSNQLTYSNRYQFVSDCIPCLLLSIYSLIGVNLFIDISVLVT